MLKSNFSFFLKNLKIINSNKKLHQKLFNFRTFASKAELEEKLNQKLKIDKLEVIDMSGNCGTSFQIKIKSNIIKYTRNGFNALYDVFPNIKLVILPTNLCELGENVFANLDNIDY